MFDRTEMNYRQGIPPDGARDNLRMLQQAAVRIELMTGDPNWDLYLSYVQPVIESAKRARDAYQSDLSNPMIVNREELEKRRIAVIRLNERIAALEWVISLPAEVRKTGVVAAERLKALPEMETA